jgi:putative hydrolase of the HAD superfamily
MTERSELEAVLLDAGGTLVRLDFEWMAAALLRLGFATDADQLRRAEVEGRKRYDESCGPADAGASPPIGATGDARAYFGGMVAAAGAPAELIAPAVDRFLAHERSSSLWSRPVEGAREMLDALETMGVRRAVVSNSDGRAELHLRNAGLLAGVEFVVDSHLVGFAKPDPRIFRVALERMGVPPDRALYVGDILAVDAVGARAAGLDFVLLDPAGDYAPPGISSIAAVGELPHWIATRSANASREPSGVHQESQPRGSGLAKPAGRIRC